MNEMSSIATYRSALSFLVSLNLEYSNLHMEHSSYWSIRSTFFTCWTLAEKGSVFFFPFRCLLKGWSVTSICFCTKQFFQCLVMPTFTGNWIRENMERVKNLLGKLNRFADVTGVSTTLLYLE